MKRVNFFNKIFAAAAIKKIEKMKTNFLHTYVGTPKSPPLGQLGGDFLKKKFELNSKIWPGICHLYELFEFRLRKLISHLAAITKIEEAILFLKKCCA